MVRFVLERFSVVSKHFCVIWGDDTVKTLFLVWGHFSGSVVWNELDGFVNCLWWGQESHQILNGSGWPWWGADSVEEQLAHGLLIKLYFLLFLLFKLWSQINWVIKVGLDVTKWNSCTEEEEHKASSQLNI